jgi:hypothetical protein
MLNVVAPLKVVWFQRGLRHSDSAECGHQEAEQTLPECHPCKESLQRVQTDEAGQPQKRKFQLRFDLKFDPKFDPKSYT